MLLHVPEVLSAAQVALCRHKLDGAAWADGRITAGHQSARAKHNLQLPESDPLARELGALVLENVQRSPMFFAAALPHKIFPPLFNCYGDGQAFGAHVDNAIRYDRSGAAAEAVRTDLSATLFLSAPEEYDGGELVIEDSFGTHAVKLPVGDLVLYPASSLHQVTPVTRGARFAAFFWVQSMVREDGERRLLFDLDLAIQSLGSAAADAIVQAAQLRLTSVYHNLLRRWADV